MTSLTPTSDVPPTVAAGRLEFRLLGPVEVAAGGRLLNLGGVKQRSVLALLVMHAPAVVASDWLIEEVWAGSPPETAQAVVRTYVSHLRRALGSAGALVLETRRPGYALRVDPDQIDLRRFERLVSEGRAALVRGAAGEARVRLAEALGLWRGRPLADLADEPFATAEVDRLESLRLDAIEDHAEAALLLGDHAEMAGPLQELVRANPLRERMRAQLMLALYRCQRQAEALAAYQAALRELGDELGIDPSPQLQRLYERILRQSPELDWQPASSGPITAPTVAPPAGELDCPYPGMATFGEGDKRFFRGREKEVADLAQRLRHHRFVLIVGPSGSGKSSLVFAGPAALGTTLGLGDATTLTDPLVAAQRVDALLATGPARRLLLVVDQLEEVFAQADRTERTEFLEALGGLRRVRRCVVVVTMRADFYPELMESPLWPLTEGERFEVTPLHGPALSRAIAAPAAELGVEVEPALLERLLADAAQEPGVLPLVQETMVLLWERRDGHRLTLDSYESLGRDGVSGLAVALATKADATLAELPPAEREVARRILLRLVQVGDGRDDTRRQQPVEHLRAAADDPRLFDRTLRHLAASRLLTLSAGEGDLGPRVDLAHEALIAGWPTLGRWIEDDRESLRVQRQIAEDSHDWHALGRDPGSLYRGARLAAAISWYDQHVGELTALECDFLEASREAAAVELSEARRQAAQRLRTARRMRRLATGFAVLLVLSLVAGSQAVVWSRRAGFQASVATDRYLAARAVDELADRLDRSLLLALESLRHRNHVEGYSALLAGLDRSRAIRAFLNGHAGRAPAVAFDAGGTLLATGSDHGTVFLWEVDGGQRLGEPLAGHTGPVEAVAFTPEGSTLLSGSLDGTIRSWDVRARRESREPLRGHVGAVRTIAVHPDGGVLASGGDDGSVILWDLAAGRPSGEPLAGLDTPVTSVAFSPDGRLVAAAGAGGVILVWDVQTGRRHGSPLTGHTGPVRTVAFAPDGRTIASGGDDGTIRLWNVSDGTALGAPLFGDDDRIRSVTYRPDGRMLAAGTDSSRVVLWDLQTRAQVEPSLDGHGGPVRSVAFAPDGRTLASGSNDGTVVLWDTVAPSGLLRPLGGHADWVRDVVFSSDGTLVSGAQDGSLRVWDPEGGRAGSRRLRGHEAPVSGVTLTPDQQRVVSWAEDGSVVLQHFRGRRDSRPVALPGDRPLVSGALSPDGGTLATVDDKGAIVLRDIPSGRPRGGPLRGHEGPVLAVAFSPDGARLASAGDDRTVRLWDVTTGGPIGAPLRAHDLAVRTLDFSPDGRVLASGGNDGRIYVWDLESGRPLGEPLTSHDGPIFALAFSPDGTTFASGSLDRTIILWDAASRVRIGEPLAGHESVIRTVAYRPDGRALASGAEDQRIILWDLDRESWRRRACTVANRNLTVSEWNSLVGAQRPYARSCPVGVELPRRRAAPVRPQLPRRRIAAAG